MGVVLFVSKAIVEGVGKRREKKKEKKEEAIQPKLLTTKTWYLGRVYRMHHKIGNRWIEY